MGVAEALLITASVLIIVTNLSLIALILTSRTLRHTPSNLIIACIAFGHLLIGSFVLPFYIRFHYMGPTEDCSLNVALPISFQYISIFVVAWSMVTFSVYNVTKFHRSMTPKWLIGLQNCCSQRKICILWSYVAGPCFIIPVVWASLRSHKGAEDELMCMLMMPSGWGVMLAFFCLHLPYYLCIADIITILVFQGRGCYRELPPSLTTDRPEEEVEGESRAPIENPVLASFPMIVYAIGMFLLIVDDWLILGGPHGQARSQAEMMEFGAVVSALITPIVLPFTWLVFNDIKTEAAESLRNVLKMFQLCCSKPATSTPTTVTFSRLQETQAA
ncbi:uncharacterized protein LOC131931770 [Physella acuta]|uniref:uncharacterized protein LOC131931770 n=1 Tax=Physella acuta TaxID=109671 RepID=UPI0027DEA8D4|nr:uncharacterized protein LOC131931770 [Physella acuta]